MEIVLDANILFRTLISHGQIVTLLFDDKLKTFAPERLKEEFFKHKKEILEKSSLSEEEINELTSLLFEGITFVKLDEYKEFLPKAKQLLGKHEKDEDFIAVCLMKNCKVWTYEQFLFNIGFGISTKQIAEMLK